MMDNINRHQMMMEELHDLYVRKNTDYGDSFNSSCDEWGITAGIVRIADKWNRVRSVVKNGKVMVKESVRDTLIDMANYCIMLVMWIDTHAENGNGGE